MTDVKIRQGRKVGRTLYRQIGPEPSDDDPLIGVMDSIVLAHLVVTAVNTYLAEHGEEAAGRPFG